MLQISVLAQWGNSCQVDGSTKLIGLYLADLLGCTAAGANKLVFCQIPTAEGMQSQWFPNWDHAAYPPLTLHLHAQSVVGEGYLRGEGGGEVGVEAYVVGGVDEKGLAGMDLADEVQGFVESLVGGMWLPAQGVDDERLYADELRQGLFGQAAEVGDVGQAIFPLPGEDGETGVVDYKRAPNHAAHFDGLARSYVVETDVGHARIFVFHKTIGHALPLVAGTECVGVDVDGSLRAVGTQVVESAHVVIVFMGEQHGTDGLLAHRFGQAEHLLPEVRPAVEEQRAFGRFEQGRSAQTPVAGVGGCTHRTVAAQLRHTCAGSRAEKMQTEGHFVQLGIKNEEFNSMRN